MPLCRKCGQYFETSASNHKTNQKDCPKHSFWMTRGGGKHLNNINAKAAELKQAADESGNPIIWRPGMPLENLPEGMRKRVEIALNLGI
jgi:hypothetical protein